jgi:hypothetical protein
LSRVYSAGIAASFGGVGLLVMVDVMSHNAMELTRWIQYPGRFASSPQDSRRSSHAGSHRLVPVQPQFAAAAEHCINGVIIVPLC